VLTVLWESERIAVVDKPAGLPVIPRRNPAPGETCLRDVVRAVTGGPVFVVHRIDAGTSGTVLFAKDADAHRSLCLAFERHVIRKYYVCVAAGCPPAEGAIHTPLRPARRGKMQPAAPGEPGLPSETRFRVLEQGGGYALVAAFPLTGRQHQIRVHFRSVGFPIAGDPLYASGAAKAFPRLLLHQHAVKFPLPGATEWRTVTAPIPADFTACLARAGLPPDSRRVPACLQAFITDIEEIPTANESAS